MNTNYMLLTNKQDYGKVIKRIGGKSYIYKWRVETYRLYGCVFLVWESLI